MVVVEWKEELFKDGGVVGFKRLGIRCIGAIGGSV